MINELNEQSCRLGMKINMKKTKVMFNNIATAVPVHIGTHEIERVHEYVYLGQLVTMTNDTSEEIKRRIAAGWSAFSKYRDLLVSKLPMCLKRKLYNQCILPAMTYGCQTWALTKRMEDRLRYTQRAMSRAMIGVTKRDHKTNEWVRLQTGLQSIVMRVKQVKWQWAGHVARINDNRWTKQVTEWIPIDKKRKRARPKTRWVDDITKFLGKTWMRSAADRVMWKHHGEAFIQQWIDNS